MFILRQVVVLLSLVSFLKAQNPAPTLNPECNGMNTAAKHLKHALVLAIHVDAQCKPNIHCTGVKCSWPDGGLLEVDLHHCQDPVYYHVLLKYPDFGISKNLNVTKGKPQTLYQHKVATVKIQVLKLERTNDIVTTTVKLEVCTPIGCLPQNVMDNQKFCVRMQNCPGFNASVHDYKPCGYKPTGHITTTPPLPRHSSSGASPSDGTFLHQKGGDGHGHGHGDDKKGGLSTAAIIGICAAAIVAILVIVGVVVYWKKYHHRSRLRAAYYNDISMHDPLYEDFGPEVA